MTRSGDLPISETAFSEQYIQVTLNIAPPVGQWNYYNVGSFTMPCAGSAVAHTWGRFSWSNGACYISYLIGGATPAAAEATAITSYDGHEPGIFGASKVDIPCFARWNGLTKGQTVSVVTQSYVNAAATYEYNLVLVRMFRT